MPQETAIDALPAELLLHVMTLALPEHPAIETWEYRQRLRSLYSFALVHRTWTPLAQELLFEDIRLNEGLEGMARKGRQLLRGTDKFKPKTLMVEGSLDILLSATYPETWSKVTRLDYSDSTNLIDLNSLDRFPLVEILLLNLSRYELPKLSDTLVFPNLRKLAFNCIREMNGRLSDYQELFSPSRLPNLTHLALDLYAVDDWDKVFDRIAPQIIALAISNEIWDDSVLASPTSLMLLKSTSRWSSLKHLAFNNDTPNAVVPSFGEEVKDLNLDTFHVELPEWEWDEVTGPLFALSQGEVETFKTKRFIVHNYLKEEVARVYPDEDLDKIEWLESSRLSFLDFDEL